MLRRTWLICWSIIGLSACVAGCEQVNEQLSRFTNSGGSEDADAELIEFEPDESTAPESDTLEFTLKIGDRFPLLKRVEQTLTQQTTSGPALSRSTLELLMAIEVEEIREGSKRLGVRYHRVRYQQDIAGQRMEYDSDAPPTALPAELQVYAGLLDNGFSFWIGPDNQIQELVGFNEFMQRCVRSVPAGQQQAVLTRLAETSGEEGIANFVDESIGLLPQASDAAGGAVAVGDSWIRQREVARPVPLYVSHNCTLKSLDDATAEIDVVGTIAASTTYGPQAADPQASRITVRGGQVRGNCTIDRRSGLPVRSHSERRLDMSIQLAGGESFEQQKHVVTSIHAFPQDSSLGNAPGVAAGAGQPSAATIVPASHAEVPPDSGR